MQLLTLLSVLSLALLALALPTPLAHHQFLTPSRRHHQLAQRAASSPDVTPGLPLARAPSAEPAPVPKEVVERALLPRTQLPQAPFFPVYTDAWVSPLPSPADLQGFNVLILSFLLASGPVDQAEQWAQLSSSDRQSLKSQYAAAGISVMVSAFGSKETPTSSGEDPAQLAGTMAQWVLSMGLDGIDIDYEVRSVDQPQY